MLTPVLGRTLNNEHRLATSKPWDVSFVVLYLHGLKLRVELPSVQPVPCQGYIQGVRAGRHDPVVFEQRTLLCFVTPLPSKKIEGQEPGLSPSPAMKGLEGPGLILVCTLCTS